MSVECVKADGAELKELLIKANEQLVVVVFGRVGVGKTTIANEIAARLGVSTLSSDVFRRRRFGGSQYEPEHSEVAIEEMISSAQEQFDEGVGAVVLDATFLKLEYRQKARELAMNNNKKLIWIEVTCDEKSAAEGNIDGKYVSRSKDETVDIQARIVIENSVRRQDDMAEQLKALVDSLMA